MFEVSTEVTPGAVCASLATALLHTSGIGLALLAHGIGREQWLRLTGIAVALCGGGLLFAA